VTPSRIIDSSKPSALLAFLLAFLCAGCLHNRVAASAPVAIVPQPDSEMAMNVAPDTDASPPEPAAAAPPVLFADAPAPPLTGVPGLRAPSAPPKPPAEQPSPQPVPGASHPPAPQISPQMSQQAQQALQRQINDDLSVAGGNLQQANGRSLSSTQQALLGTARSYVQQARDAAKDGDWVRAQNLAHKARLASIDFVSSL
jgi:hypothetical protein